MSVEPTIGIEPMNLFLTKEALYRLSYVGVFFWFVVDRCAGRFVLFPQPRRGLPACTKLERETRLELATFSLEG